MRSIRFGLLIFQSTLPRRERQSSGINAISKSPISIHTPTKGATLPVIKYAGCETISIHTPTKGATHTHHCFFARLINFNPHSHEGSDKVIVQICPIISTFQSTLPRRERQKILFCLYGVVYFNPHSHEGSDRRKSQRNLRITNFNPHSHEGSDWITTRYYYSN